MKYKQLYFSISKTQHIIPSGLACHLLRSDLLHLFQFLPSMFTTLMLLLLFFL